jgi:ferric-dicitrate binding protein FerR (iron transport regulator)
VKTSPEFPAELEELLGALRDGLITREQAERLDQWLGSDASAREYYLLYIELCATLHHYQGTLIPSPGEGRSRGTSAEALSAGSGATSAPGPRSLKLRFAGMVVAAALMVAMVPLAVIGLGGWRGGVPRTADVVAIVESTTTPEADVRSAAVAILTRAIDATWEGGGPSPSVGSPLLPGVLRLRSGILRIDFLSGATAMVQGPAELELKSENRVGCRAGHLRVVAPPHARGFRVDSPAVDLVDLGTEFGLQVVPGLQSEVYVFDGKVELYEPGALQSKPLTWRELSEGQGIRIEEAGAITSLSADPRSFLSLDDLERRYLERSRRRYGAWIEASRVQRADPRLVINFSFEGERQPGSRRLLNQRGEGGLHGAIVGCEWVDGRWPGKGALEFKHPGDRVRMRVPGEFDSLTLAASVRVDAFERFLNALMLTDGHDWGEPHWQISRDGRIILGIAPKNYTSPQVITPERLGRWIHLVTVFDSKAGTVTHYVDGAAVWSEPIVTHGPLRIGDAEIGNWGAPTRNSGTSVRNFCGRIDEFLLYQGALSADEVRALYERGADSS